MPDSTSAARSLALPLDDDTDGPILPIRGHPKPAWQRRDRPAPSQSPRWRQTTERWNNHAVRAWKRLTPLQRVGALVLGLMLSVGGLLFLIYHQRVFHWLAPVAETWRGMPAGWLLLWAMTFAVAFPPMIGYATCVTTAGFVFGMPGFFIVATATVAGSVCAFLASRTALKQLVARLTERNREFAALSLVLKHDGLKLLVMIRLCPLPYSLSNGAVSTIPTVSPRHFALASALATPKLLVGVFIGSRLGDLAANGDTMDARTKAISYISILIGTLAGLATGYLVYTRTHARARQLEAEEAAAASHRTGPLRHARSSSSGGDYIDSPGGLFPAAPRDHFRPGGDDGISMHTTTGRDEDDGDGDARLDAASYRDDFTDDEDAREHDVFDLGDGLSDVDEAETGKGQ